MSKPTTIAGWKTKADSLEQALAEERHNHHMHYDELKQLKADLSNYERRERQLREALRDLLGL